MGQLELGQVVKVTTKLGDEKVFEGKVMDFSKMQTQLWIENEVDIYRFNMHHVEVVLVEQEEKFDSSTLPAQDLLTMGELNKAIEQDAKEEGLSIRYDLEGARIMIYNNGEGYIRDNKGDWIDNLECWDCELVLLFEDDERVYKTFGTFFNEKDALKHARTMRSKLKAGKYPDIEKDIEIYTC